MSSADDQYAAPQYVRLLQAAGVQISMAAVGEPTQNRYAERVIRTIKEEESDLAEYHDFDDAHAQIGRFELKTPKNLSSPKRPLQSSPASNVLTVMKHKDSRALDT